MSEMNVPLREAMLVATDEKSVKDAAATLGWSTSKFYKFLRSDEALWDKYTGRRGTKTRKGKHTLTYAEHKERDRIRHGHHGEAATDTWMRLVKADLQKRKEKSKLVEKALAARAAGMTYGYYVAFVLERRGHITWQNAE